METIQEEFAKQYATHEIFCENADKQVYAENVIFVRPSIDYHVVQPYPRLNFNRQYDEPIDLTQTQCKVKIEQDLPQPKNAQTLKSNRGRRPKVHCVNPTIANQLPNYFKDVIELQATESKQVEIMKAAKSLFSKRTRTLYHWMYPNTSKQQIKMAVLKLWDNLTNAEKQFYISQVLVKFGFPQCNLMVNPQLGGIKEIPPLPDTFENNFAAKELQNAISSISDGPAPVFEGKRRQGRPLGSKNKKNKNDVVSSKFSRDFQDDPELSKELEKFAISFDCFK